MMIVAFAIKVEIIKDSLSTEKYPSYKRAITGTKMAQPETGS